MKHYRNLLQVGAGLLAATQLTQAVVIYETYDGETAQSSNGVVSYNTGTGGGFRLALAFLTDSQAYTLESVTLHLSRLSGSSLWFGLNLCEDVFEGGVHRPGTSLGALTTVSSIPTTSDAVSFTAAALALQPNTTYWIVAGPSLLDSSIFFWYEGSTAAGYLSSSRSGGAWSPWSEVPDASLAIVVHGTPVPEPATWGVIAAGLAAISGPLLRGRLRGQGVPSGSLGASPRGRSR
jgi:hypothetical protein